MNAKPIAAKKLSGVVDIKGQISRAGGLALLNSYIAALLGANVQSHLQVAEMIAYHTISEQMLWEGYHCAGAVDLFH